MKQNIFLLLAIVIVMATTACHSQSNKQEQENKSMTTATVQRLTGAELREKLNSEPGVILDVRTPGEFAGGHLAGALNYDFLGGVFAEKMNSLDKEKTYYLYCASGNRSGQSAQMMVNAGFSNVYNAGGFHELATAGLPTE